MGHYLVIEEAKCKEWNDSSRDELVVAVEDDVSMFFVQLCRPKIHSPFGLIFISRVVIGQCRVRIMLGVNYLILEKLGKVGGCCQKAYENGGRCTSRLKVKREDIIGKVHSIA